VRESLQANEAVFRSLAFSPDGKTLVSAGRDQRGAGGLILWDVATWQKRRGSLPANEWGVSAIAFRPDGRFFATGGANGESHGNLIFWGAEGTPEPPLDASEYPVRSLAFSPDGKMLVTGGANRRGLGDLIIWDVDWRQPLGPPLKVGAWPVVSVAFSPDGRALTAASSGPERSSLWTWEIGLSTWQEKVRQIVHRNLSRQEWDQYIGLNIPYQRTFPDLPAGRGATESR
jgi:WD40 repeat protein